MKPITHLLILFAFFISACAAAQNEGVSIKSSGGAPDPSAMLDVVSGTKGLLIPRLTFTSITSPAPTSSPADGLLAYNTNTAVGEGKGFYYWSQDASKWIRLSTGSELWKKISTTNDIHYENTGTDKVVIGSASPTPTFNLEVRATETDTYACRFDAAGDAQLRFGYLDLNAEAGSGVGSFLTQKSPTVVGGGGSYTARYTQLYSDGEVGFMLSSMLKNYSTNGTTLMQSGGNNDLHINGGRDLLLSSGSASVLTTLTGSGWSHMSDSTMKKNISNEGPALEKILQCRPVTYRFKTQAANAPLTHGLIAQEVESVYPELVTIVNKPTVNGFGLNEASAKKTLNYTEFVPILLKAIQEQQALINDLKTRVQALEQH